MWVRSTRRTRTVKADTDAVRGTVLAEERSAGAVAYQTADGALALLMIKDAFGNWTFPKGLIEAGETPQEAALRELAEETGVTGEITTELGVAHYTYARRQDRKVVGKQAVFYLVAAAPGCKLQASPDEVAAIEWVSLGEVAARLDYRNLQLLLDNAQRTLLGCAAAPEVD